MAFHDVPQQCGMLHGVAHHDMAHRQLLGGQPDVKAADA